MEIVNPADGVVASPAEPTGSSTPQAAGTSRLERVRRKAEIARANRHFDLPLSHVDDGLGLRLGLPSTGASVAADLTGDIEAALEFLAQNVLGVSELVEGEWGAVDGLDPHALATTYGSVLRGAEPTLTTPKDIVTELFREGSPAVPNATWVTWATVAYRSWAMSDPTEGR